MKNKLLFIFSFLMSTCFYTPIFALYFEKNYGMTNSQITLLFSLYTISVFVFEIPTGLLSDRIGEKYSLVIGSFLVCISTFFFVIGNILLIFIGEIFFGISRTFFSGSFESYIYHYSSKFQVEYGNTLSKAYTLQWIALCTSFIGCSVISIVSPIKTIFIFTLIFNLVCLIVSFFVPEIRYNKNLSYLKIFTDGIKDLKSNRNLLLYSIHNSLFLSFIVCGYHVFQIFLTDTLMVDTLYFNGIIYFLGALCASFGSFLFEKKGNKVSSDKKNLILSALLFSLCLIGFYLFPLITPVIILFCIFRIIWGWSMPVYSVIVNKHISNDSSRSTILSIISLFSNIFESIILLLLGFIMHSNHYYLVLFILVLLYIVSLYKNLCSKEKIYNGINDQF